MDRYQGLIVSDPRVMMGKPVIAGTRINVELIPEKLAAGETEEQILDARHRPTREAFRAALAFAAKALRSNGLSPRWDGQMKIDDPAVLSSLLRKSAKAGEPREVRLLGEV